MRITVGGLSAAHIGQRIRIPGLHQPGTDWGAPKVTVEGTLTEIRTAKPFGFSGRYVWLVLKPKPANLDTPLPLSQPIELI